MAASFHATLFVKTTIRTSFFFIAGMVANAEFFWSVAILTIFITTGTVFKPVTTFYTVQKAVINIKPAFWTYSKVSFEYFAAMGTSDFLMKYFGVMLIRNRISFCKVFVRYLVSYKLVFRDAISKVNHKRGS